MKKINLLLVLMFLANTPALADKVDELKRGCDGGNEVSCFDLGVMYMAELDTNEDLIYNSEPLASDYSEQAAYNSQLKAAQASAAGREVYKKLFDFQKLLNDGNTLLNFQDGDSGFASVGGKNAGNFSIFGADTPENAEAYLNGDSGKSVISLENQYQALVKQFPTVDFTEDGSLERVLKIKKDVSDKLKAEFFANPSKIKYEALFTDKFGRTIINPVHSEFGSYGDFLNNNGAGTVAYRNVTETAEKFGAYPIGDGRYGRNNSTDDVYHNYEELQNSPRNPYYYENKSHNQFINSANKFISGFGLLDALGGVPTVEAPSNSLNSLVNVDTNKSSKETRDYSAISKYQEQNARENAQRLVNRGKSGEAKNLMANYRYAKKKADNGVVSQDTYNRIITGQITAAQLEDDIKEGIKATKAEYSYVGKALKSISNLSADVADIINADFAGFEVGSETNSLSKLLGLPNFRSDDYDFLQEAGSELPTFSDGELHKSYRESGLSPEAIEAVKSLAITKFLLNNKSKFDISDNWFSTNQSAKETDTVKDFKNFVNRAVLDQIGLVKGKNIKSKRDSDKIITIKDLIGFSGFKKEYKYILERVYKILNTHLK